MRSWQPGPGLFEAARTERAIRHLSAFIRQAWHIVEPSKQYVHGWHIDCISEHLEAVSNGQIKNLVVNVPPGTMKSLAISVMWFCWKWISAPETRWLFASYQQNLSTRDAKKARDIIVSDWYQSRFGNRFKLMDDQNQKIRYSNDKTGWRISTSIGGLSTGEHPDVVVTDDPQNVKKAESELDRRKVKDWWDMTITSRGASRDCARVIVMQRLHQEDLSGHVLKRKGEFVHLMLPMEYDPKRHCVTSLGWQDPRKVEGELLWPELFPREKVEELKIPLGSYGVSGQFQQTPILAEGAMFQREWFEIVDAAPRDATRLRWWDKAASTKKKSDYTAGPRLAQCNKTGIVYIEDMKHGKFASHEREELIKQTAILDQIAFNGEVTIWAEQEPGSSGVDSALATAKNLAGFTFFYETTSGTKEAAARPLASYAKAGNVKLVKGEWNEAFLNEIAAFPLGAHDDQVDAVSKGFNKLTLGNLWTRKEELFIASAADVRDYAPEKCSRCHGQRTIERMDESGMMVEEPCPECQGKGTQAVDMGDETLNDLVNFYGSRRY